MGIIVAWILVGILTGAIASLFTGAQPRERVIVIGLGVAGGVLGGALGRAIDTSEVQLGHMLGAILGAAVLVGISRIRDWP